MKTLRSINSTEVTKKIALHEYYNEQQFINDCIRYIKAIKDGRMVCNIISVSNSGMSRNIKFLSCEKGNKYRPYYYSNYNMLFTCLGFSKARNNDFAFTIGGCGMDMIFHTNYTIIHKLGKLGFLNKKEVAKYAQMTPTII